MALQTIQQILSPTNAPYINGTQARLTFAEAYLKNMWQGLVERNDKGINDNWVKEGEAESSAQIFVNRVLPVKMKPRELGASKNGAAYSQNQHFPLTETVGIEILTVMDDVILLPRCTQDHISVDLLKEQIQAYVDRLNPVINGATYASKVLASYVAKANGDSIREFIISQTDIDNEKILRRFVFANASLDKGDKAHGIDIFPRRTRICVVKNSFGPILKTDGVLKLGGANEAYAILKAAGISNSGERIEEDGYIGTIDGVEVRALSEESLAQASYFLGFPEEELTEAPLYGYIASSYANARGVSVSEQTKVVDEPNGQGIRLQPYTKFGVVCWYPLGNAFLLSEEYDPFGGLKTLFPSVTFTFKLKGAGSRLYPEFSASGVVIASSTAFSCSGTHAYDDFNVDHLKGGYYCVTSKAAGPLTTVHEFIKAATAVSAKAGTYAIDTGASQSVSAMTDGDWVTVLAVADDGSCSLFSAQYEA